MWHVLLSFEGKMSIFVPIRASSWTQTVYQLATKSFPGQCYNYKFISTVPSHQSCVAAVRLTPNKQITTEQSFVLKRFMATEKQRSKQVAERVHGTSQGEITLGRKGWYCKGSIWRCQLQDLQLQGCGFKSYQANCWFHNEYFHLVT